MVKSIKNPKKAIRKARNFCVGLKERRWVFFLFGTVYTAKVWQPGVDKLEEGEELQCDPSAYNSFSAFHIGRPCFRYIEVRTEFPHAVNFVAGTEATKVAIMIGFGTHVLLQDKRKNRHTHNYFYWEEVPPSLELAESLYVSCR